MSMQNIDIWIENHRCLKTLILYRSSRIRILERTLENAFVDQSLCIPGQDSFNSSTRNKEQIVTVISFYFCFWRYRYYIAMEHRKLSEISLFQLFHFTRNIAGKNGFVYFPRRPPYLFALNEHPKLSRSPWRVLLLRATIVTASGLSWRRRSKWMGRLIETAANKLVDRRGLISWPKLLARRYGCLRLSFLHLPFPKKIQF